jgi:hypothetical protein
MFVGNTLAGRLLPIRPWKKAPQNLRSFFAAPAQKNPVLVSPRRSVAERLRRSSDFDFMEDPPHVNQKLRFRGRKNKIFFERIQRINPAKNATFRAKIMLRRGRTARCLLPIARCHAPRDNRQYSAAGGIMKWIKRIFVVVVLLIIVVIAIAHFTINGIIRATVEKGATMALNVPTTLNSANLSLLGGSLSLNGLDVGAPAGFTSHMLTVDGLKVIVNYSELRGQPIHISEIDIDNPNLTVEMSGTKLNIQALQQSSQSASPAPASPSGQSSSAGSIKLIVDKLALTNAKVGFNAGLPGLTSPTSVTVPSLILTNIGNSGDSQSGDTLDQVVLQTITALTAKAQQSGNLPSQLNTVLNADLSQVAGNLGTQFNSQFQSIVNNSEQNLTKSVPSNLGNQLNGLLGNNAPGKTGQ